MNQVEAPTQPAQDQDDPPSLLEAMVPLARHWRMLLVLPLASGAVAAAVTFLVPRTFTAQTVFLPPQQSQQSSASAALASLGALAGIAGGSTALRTPADQYVSILQSATIADRIVDRFSLMAVYEEALRSEARKELAERVRVSAGRKDGLITVAVDDHSPARAAEMANAYVEELRRVTASLAVTEAQQRRVFFEGQMLQTRERLTRAESALQASGFTQGTLRAEPRAAADQYARLRSEVTSAEVRLQMLRSAYASDAPEVVGQLAALSALRSQLARAEQPADSGNGGGYIEKYREFKYQETLFELFARQYELARVDESREGTLIQVLDLATPPDRKSKPRRALIATITAGAVLGLLVVLLLARHAWGRVLASPSEARAASRLRAAVRRR